MLEEKIIKEFIINKNNIEYGLQIIKFDKEDSLILKAFKKNCIYNNIFVKKINLEFFITLNYDFQKVNNIDSILEILFDIINAKSIIIKELKNDSLILILTYNKIESKIILNKEINFFSNKTFIINPNIFYKETITNNNDSCGISDIFEVFNDFNNNIILASPNKNNHRIDLYNLDKQNSLIKSLKGHNNFITFIKSFNDSIKNKKFLMSIDDIKLVIIWDIKNSYLKKKLILDYKGNIYSAFLLFNIYDNDYIITSSYNLLEYTKLFSLENCKLIRNINCTDNNYTRYIIPWEKENYNGLYIIELCDEKISIINIFEDELNIDLSLGDKTENYCNGFLYNKKNIEYLCVGGFNGNIYLFNLKELVLENIIETCAFNGIGYIIHWKENIIIGTNFIDRGLIIIDIQSLKVVSLYQYIQDKGIVCIKKFNHSIYGESLLVGSNNGSITLWTTYSF